MTYPSYEFQDTCLWVTLWNYKLKTVSQEKAMAPHSSTLAWKIPRTEEPGRLQSMGSLRVEMTELLHFHFSLSCIGEGNSNPLQCSRLENPRDGGVYGGHTESDTTEWLYFHFHFSLSCIGEGNGNPLQCSCLENPRDGGVYGVAQSRPRLKRLSSSSSSYSFMASLVKCPSNILPTLDWVVVL